MNYNQEKELKRISGENLQSSIQTNKHKVFNVKCFFMLRSVFCYHVVVLLKCVCTNQMSCFIFTENVCIDNEPRVQLVRCTFFTLSV